MSKMFFGFFFMIFSCLCMGIIGGPAIVGGGRVPGVKDDSDWLGGKESDAKSSDDSDGTADLVEENIKAGSTSGADEKLNDGGEKS